MLGYGAAYGISAVADMSPPEFMPETPLACEGYWADAASARQSAEQFELILNPPGGTVFMHPESEARMRRKIAYLNSLGDYRPIPSTRVWHGKKDWLRKVNAIEAYIRTIPGTQDDFPMNMDVDERRQRRVTAYWRSRGLSPSRLVPGVMVSSDEYEDFDQDRSICWPGGYVGHYIQDGNVMPTRTFYDYVNRRYETLPVQYKLQDEY